MRQPRPLVRPFARPLLRPLLRPFPRPLVRLPRAAGGRSVARAAAAVAAVAWLGAALLFALFAASFARATPLPVQVEPSYTPGTTPMKPALPITVRDDRAVALTFVASPQRIVSLLPSLTESVCALGGCARLVGTDRYSNWPAAVARLPKLGGLEDANLERIVALQPEVVLVAPSSRVIERLQSLGVQVLVLESKTHADVQRSLGVLAQLLGTPDAAALVWAAMAREVAAAAARVPPSLRGQRVYFEVDATPYAAGASSFIGETLAQLHMANAVPAALGPFPQLNPEFVVRAQPDVVMAGQRDLAAMPRRPGWNRLTALRDGRTCGFAAAHYDVLVRPGPRLGEAASLLADCLVHLDVATP